LSYDEMALAAIEHLYPELGTGPEGLSNQEASLRLQKYGPNVLPMGHRDNLAERFFIQFKNMFNILLLVASFLSFASGIVVAIIYAPFLQPLFGTAPLLLSDWLFLSTLAPLAFILEELTKISMRKIIR
jgi:magnesium-transporting ATPase (P-type)